MTPSERDPVQFTRESAERIANVVRAAELSPSQGRPLSFDAQQPSARAKVFRLATFTGDWPKDGSVVVTLLNQTSTPNTVTAYNKLYPVAQLSTNAPQAVAIAKEGTAWYFVNTEGHMTKRRVVSDISIVAGGQPSLLVTYIDAWIPSQPSSPESESKLFPVADCES